ncbi:MAG TPA: putative zinc-binding metallopeptidase [Terriglobales bacterium]|nr:putative zinc-binding metallopeptidase [Terriglobales bacterium]
MAGQSGELAQACAGAANTFVDRVPAEVQAIMATRICDLGLKIEGSPVERYVGRLYRELERKRLANFRPQCYLSDEWGCPSGEPTIGIPLYLADARLAVLERELNDLEGPVETMQYMRHEAGHAFNYAYELYKRDDWQQLFGSFRRAYRDDYRAIPFARQFVTYLPGWYAQKHPDEDFAETFAVWLTPGSNWRARYRNTPALHKLLYVDQVARRVRNMKPARPTGEADLTVDEMDYTVAEFYERTLQEQPVPAQLPSDTELAGIFRSNLRGRKKLRPAAALVKEHRKALADSISQWTGVQRPLVKRLVETIESRLAALDVKADSRLATANLLDLMAYTTVLALNNLEQRRKPVREKPRSRETAPAVPIVVQAPPVESATEEKIAAAGD